jgi:AAA domain, putative AbiEii toxin, Type IV TA system
MKKENLKISTYERGSEWRRWDLHIHTPESRLGDSFSGITWTAYVEALEKAALEYEIAVIGVTDYMTIDGYEKLYADHTDPKSQRLKSVKLLLPNIELRALPSTTSDKALNIHLIVDPLDTDHIAKIKKALGNLRITYKEQTYGCSKKDLIDFARAQNPLLVDDENAYKFGIEQFKPSYEQISDWLNKEGWLKSNSLIAITNGGDGISGLPADGFSAIRDQLINSSHLIFSGNPSDRSYYLGQKNGESAAKIKQMYRSLKPCVHGSDAHSIDKFFKPDQERACWIKADPTFEGLRQILWEPETRVYIGKSKPQPVDLSQVIDKVCLESTNGWFAQSSIKLNSGLVAIIGEKGAGKTAIADLIAFSSGEAVESKSQSSFITKGHLHLKGLSVKLGWANGNRESSGTLPDKPYSIQRPLVRYLSQDFVEQLCSSDHEGGKLQSAIEEVVFSRLDELHKEGFSSFEELRSAREKSSQIKQDDIRGQLAAMHREIERLHQSIAQKPVKEAIKKQTESQLIELEAQMPTASNDADQTVLSSLKIEQDKKTEIEKQFSEKSREKRSVDDLLNSYREIKLRTNQEIESLLTSASEAVNLAVRSKIFPIWDQSVEPFLSEESKKLELEMSTLQGEESKANIAAGATLFDINQRIKQLQDSLTKDELNKKRLLDLQKQIAAQEATIKRLAKEIDEIENKTAKLLKTKEADRTKLYLKFFEALAEDREGLTELYAPMKEQLQGLGADMKFELSAGYRVSTKEWLEKAARFYDGRKPAAAAKKEDIEKFVADSLLPAWQSGDQTRIGAAILSFEKLVAVENFIPDLSSPSLKLVELFDWMYSTDHIETAYKIQYGGTSIEHLSPGTRGIALLVLYLLMDEDDRRPLVIDQPEGNLDNASIYEQLVPYLRKAKEKRQIILITHNPNLVVATDAEQVIVATSIRVANQAYPQITYTAGSLEHSNIDSNHMGTRQAACTLLEGGDQAFKDREGRYSI